MELLTQLATIGSPGLLAIIAALLWDRKELKAEVKEERARTEKVVALMVALNSKLIDNALDDDTRP